MADVWDGVIIGILPKAVRVDSKIVALTLGMIVGLAKEGIVGFDVAVITALVTWAIVPLTWGMVDFGAGICGDASMIVVFIAPIAL